MERVLAATLQELDKSGYAGMRMDAVARSAGVNRTTLYRRWPKKRDLLAALVESELARFDHLSFEGNLRECLTQLLRQFADNLVRREGRVLAHAALAADPDLAALAESARVRSLGAFTSCFERAQQRGELPESADVEMMAHLLYFGVVHWVMQSGTELSDADCDRMVVAVLPQNES